MLKKTQQTEKRAQKITFINKQKIEKKWCHTRDVLLYVSACVYLSWWVPVININYLSPCLIKGTRKKVSLEKTLQIHLYPHKMEYIA